MIKALKEERGIEKMAVHNAGSDSLRHGHANLRRVDPGQHFW